MSVPAGLLDVLRRARCDLGDEKRTQAQLAEVLAAAGVGFAREVRLAPGDIVDFLTDDGIAIEVKLKGARKAEVVRQLARYARHDRVVGLVLVANLAMPALLSVGGKPLRMISLGRAWL